MFCSTRSSVGPSVGPSIGNVFEFWTLMGIQKLNLSFSVYWLVGRWEGREEERSEWQEERNGRGKERKKDLNL